MSSLICRKEASINASLMDPNLLLIIGIIFLLVLASGFFSGSETALTAASRSRLHELEKKGDPRAKIVNQLRTRSNRLIGAILLGNNLVNILASSLATGVMIAMFGEAGILYATTIMTILVLIFAEVMPKTIAINNPDKIALITAPAIKKVMWVFSPITIIIEKLVKIILRIFGIATSTNIGSGMSDEELIGAIELHASDKQNLNASHERVMLRSILDLDEVEVGEIMIHRKDVVMFNIDAPPVDTITRILECPYTRVPVWKGNPENIVGVIHAKQLVLALKSHPDEVNKIDLQKIAATPWFVPETTKLLTQLHAFRKRREHFALVVDEYGVFQGIVTLEDILEEIVGEIDDEHDITLPGIRQVDEQNFIINGAVTIRDLNRQFDWDLPDDHASTLAGLVLHETREIPDIGREFEFYGFRFRVQRRRRNRITQIKVTKLLQEDI